jgi:hypothetical protein
MMSSGYNRGNPQNGYVAQHHADEIVFVGVSPCDGYVEMPCAGYKIKPVESNCVFRPLVN